MNRAAYCVASLAITIPSLVQANGSPVEVCRSVADLTQSFARARDAGMTQDQYRSAFLKQASKDDALMNGFVLGLMVVVYDLKMAPVPTGLLFWAECVKAYREGDDILKLLTHLTRYGYEYRGRRSK